MLLPQISFMQQPKNPEIPLKYHKYSNKNSSQIILFRCHHFMLSSPLSPLPTICRACLYLEYQFTIFTLGKSHLVLLSEVIYIFTSCIDVSVDQSVERHTTNFNSTLIDEKILMRWSLKYHVRRFFALLVPDDILEFLHSSAERDMSRLNFDFFSQ